MWTDATGMHHIIVLPDPAIAIGERLQAGIRALSDSDVVGLEDAIFHYDSILIESYAEADVDADESEFVGAGLPESVRLEIPEGSTASGSSVIAALDRAAPRWRWELTTATLDFIEREIFDVVVEQPRLVTWWRSIRANSRRTRARAERAKRG